MEERRKLKHGVNNSQEKNVFKEEGSTELPNVAKKLGKMKTG